MMRRAQSTVSSLVRGFRPHSLRTASVVVQKPILASNGHQLRWFGKAKQAPTRRKNEPQVTANEDIKGSKFRVVDEDGAQLGIMQRDDAFQKAREQNQDLVLVAPDASPPVCKLTSAIKLKRKREKEKKEAQRQERANKLKEMRFTAKIEPHDLEVKIEKVRKFLREQKKNVRVTVAYNPGVPHAYQEPLRRKVLRQIVRSINLDAFVDPKTMQVQGPFIMVDLKADTVKKDPQDHFAILPLLEKPLQGSVSGSTINTSADAAAAAAKADPDTKEDVVGASQVSETSKETRATESLAEYMSKKATSLKKESKAKRLARSKSLKNNRRQTETDRVERAGFGTTHE
eukprot:gb/GECG01006810.1/.p1 GENE.gb/GECG01006810.1/~~gb/GECG01006810.1/.p1  ORF type:complete len:344 (+),score=56.15 gb/GECG01006810.1/:1-1032(+)